MAVTTTNVNSFSALNGFAGGWFSDLKMRAAKRAQYARTVRELSALSGHELADLGMSRMQIRSKAYEAVYGIK